MHRPILTSLFLIALLISSPRQMKATHAMGGELTYTWITGNTYEIKFSFYRDCMGIPAPASPVVHISSSTCNVVMTVNLFPIPGTPQMLSIVCSGLTTTCFGVSVYTGVEKWEYTSQVTLPASCPDYYFSLTECCRNDAITTITDAASYDAYFFATLNNLNIPFNNSPQFANDPIIFLSVGQHSTINNGAFDPDGDSLSIALIPARSDSDIAVTYSTPNTYLNPISSSPPLSLNPSTGDFVITPTQSDVGVVAYQVNEYRNGLLIGSITRDIQITVNASSFNSLPYLSGINNSSSFSVNACVGDTVRFMVYSYDQNLSDTTHLLWYPQGSSSFSITSFGGIRDSALVEFIADSNMVSATPYQLIMTVIDDFCPYPGRQMYSYQVYVNACSSNVWPGDANADLKCDLYDVLPIGIAYGRSGPVRNTASTNWIAQLANNWSQYFVSGVNYKHADCDGDGIVDHSDTNAISLNYGLTHPLRLSNPILPASTDLISVTANQDSVGPTDNFTIAVKLGNSLSPVNNIYGIAFHLNFNPTLFDSSQSSFHFIPSALGTPGSDLLTFYRIDWQTGDIAAVAVRTDHNNSYSDSTLALFNLKVANTISSSVISNFTLTGVRGVTSNDVLRLFSTLNDSVSVSTVPVGLKSLSAPIYFDLYPNPAQNEAFVITDVSSKGSVMIFDISGRKIQELNLESLKAKIDISQLSNGIYSVGIKTDIGQFWKKLIVSR